MIPKARLPSRAFFVATLIDLRGLNAGNTSGGNAALQ